MENRERVQTGFDERAALDELERLRGEIERYRAKRKAVSEEFDAFVRSFKTPAADAASRPRPRPEPPEVGLPDTRRRDTRLPDSVPDTGLPDSVPDAVPGTVPERREDEPVAPVAAAPAPMVARRGPSNTPVLVVGALALLAAGGGITWFVRNRAPHDAAATPVSDRQPVAPAASQAAAPPPARSSEALVSELTTSRPVWVRVIADGARVVERELPANARVPLTAEKTIVIRVGNAGAVRVTLAGQDQGVFGPEGTAVTRTFSVPRTPPR